MAFSEALAEPIRQRPARRQERSSFANGPVDRYAPGSSGQVHSPGSQKKYFLRKMLAIGTFPLILVFDCVDTFVTACLTHQRGWPDLEVQVVPGFMGRFGLARPSSVTPVTTEEGTIMRRCQSNGQHSPLLRCAPLAVVMLGGVLLSRSLSQPASPAIQVFAGTDTSVAAIANGRGRSIWDRRFRPRPVHKHLRF